MLEPHLIEFAELDSTNRYACAHLAELQHGDAIRADIQTDGRGRLNRSWLSHVPGNLNLSLVLKPDTANAGHLPLANLSQLLALATCRVIDTCDVTATVKWPNDIQVGGRKLAGILAETVTQGSHFLGLALGIGINLNLNAETLALIDQPATSLSLQAGQPVDVRHVCNALLCEFCREYDAFMKTGFTMIREEYLRRCHFLGEQIKVRQGSTVIHGRAVDVNTNGALVLTDKEDQVRVVEIAEMFQ